MRQVVEFLKEVRLELLKVTWPDRSDVVRLTAIVLALSAVVAVYAGGVDLGFTKLLEFVLSR